MAYSDYGGYAYRNGIRVVERSDAVLTPEGVQSTPGQWPGWTIEAGRGGQSFHALLGDGPIYVGLYKQSGVHVHRLAERLDPVDLLREPTPDATEGFEGQRWINDDSFRSRGVPCVLEADGCTIEVHWTYEDNYYQYVRLTQPDGSVWHGWSGYGVGAGLEDCGYGYCTKDREEMLSYLWPESITLQPPVEP